MLEELIDRFGETAKGSNEPAFHCAAESACTSGCICDRNQTDQEEI